MRFTVIPFNPVRYEIQLIPPDTVKGLNGDDWKRAIKSEITTVQNKGCREFTDASTSVKALYLKFLLCRKRDEDGVLKKHKARFVECGNEENENKEESFSSVAELTDVKILMSLFLSWK